jgi:hypothetical protein
MHSSSLLNTKFQHTSTTIEMYCDENQVCVVLEFRTRNIELITHGPTANRDCISSSAVQVPPPEWTITRVGLSARGQRWNWLCRRYPGSHRQNERELVVFMFSSPQIRCFNQTRIYSFQHKIMPHIAFSEEILHCHSVRLQQGRTWPE